MRYLPTHTLENGIKTNLLTGESKAVDDVDAELDKAVAWWRKQFYFEPTHAPVYNDLIRLVKERKNNANC